MMLFFFSVETWIPYSVFGGGVLHTFYWVVASEIGDNE